MTDPFPSKQDLRRAAQVRRRDAAVAAAPDCAEALAALGLAALADKAPGTVSGYWPIRDEIDVRPLLAALRDRGWTVALPGVMGQDVPLEFRVWRDDDRLVRAGFGIMEPGPDAALQDPDVALVPLLAFDRRGHRIGYGKGHYDRTLSMLRLRRPVLAVGIGFSAQEVPRVPVEPHDQSLDAVLTDREWIWARRDG